MSDKDPEIIYSPTAQAQIDADPKLKEAMKEIAALMRQAMQDVESGKYADFGDAMFALTGRRPERVEDADEYADDMVIEDIKRHDDDAK